MSRKLVNGLVAALLVVGVGLTSCGTRESDSDASPAATPQGISATELLGTEENSSLIHFMPSELNEIGFVNDSAKAETVADFKVSDEYILVFIRCAGAGMINIDIENHGVFPLSCDNAREMVSINQFNVSGIVDTSVSISPQGDVRWAASVAQSSEVDPEHIARFEQEYLEFVGL